VLGVGSICCMLVHYYTPRTARQYGAGESRTHTSNP